MCGSQSSEGLYETLPNLQQCFRLLEIQPASAGDDLIQCMLSTWQVDLAPSYHAISYTWGDPNSVALVRVNGRDTTVTQNCLYVLRQVRQNRFSRYYWIDTLCINQKNHHEKDFQVAMMGGIYQNAENVIVCLGQRGADSELLFQTLNNMTELFVRAAQAAPTFEQIERGHVDLDKQTRKAIMKWRLSQELSIATRLVTAFRRLQERPYFGRLWTLQERLLARRTTVCCGHSHCPGEALHGFYIAARHFDPSTWMSWRVRLVEMFPQWGKVQRLLARSMRWRCASAKYGWDLQLANPLRDMTAFSHARLLNLWDAMKYISELECHDPRDKLYGIISCVDWDGLQKPRPSYDCDIFDVALHTLQLLARYPCDFRREINYGLLAQNDAIIVAKYVLRFFKLLEQPSAKSTAFLKQRRQSVVSRVERAEGGAEGEAGPFKKALEKAEAEAKKMADTILVRYKSPTPWYGYEMILDTQESHRSSSDRLESNKGSGFGGSEERRINRLAYRDGVLTNQQGETIGLLPSSARSGDWLVLSEYDLGAVALVARRGQGHRYEVIGQAIVGSEVMAALGARSVGTEERFIMYFHVEDLIALAQSCNGLNTCSVRSPFKMPTDGLIIDQELVHCTPGFSYARRVEKKE